MEENNNKVKTEVRFTKIENEVKNIKDIVLDIKNNHLNAITKKLDSALSNFSEQKIQCMNEFAGKKSLNVLWTTVVCGILVSIFLGVIVLLANKFL